MKNKIHEKVRSVDVSNLITLAKTYNIKLTPVCHLAWSLITVVSEKLDFAENMANTVHSCVIGKIENIGLTGK